MKFAFTPMQCNFAKQLMKEHGITNVELDTLVLVKDRNTYVYTEAALEIVKELAGPWKQESLLTRLFCLMIF
jgi:predicted DCC family thiol-disulfide oxidoreductase YuxK